MGSLFKQEIKHKEGSMTFDIKFYDESKNIQEELYNRIAEDIAETLASSSGKKLSRTQLRRFFDEVKAIQRYLNQFDDKKRKKEEFRKKLPEVKMIKAKVTYARGRNKVTKEFADFIEKSISLIKTPKDFEVFCKFFEAVYGFFYFHKPN